jgi:hypothetical protein
MAHTVSSGATARVYACFDGTAWESFGKCTVVLSKALLLTVTKAAAQPKAGASTIVARADLTGADPQPILDDTQEDAMGNPCYVVVRLPSTAFVGEACPASAPARVGTALRFYDGAIAGAFVDRLCAASESPEDGEDRPGSAASMAEADGIRGSAGNDGDDELEDSDGASAQYDVSMTTVVSLLAELLRRTEDLELARAGSPAAGAPSDADEAQSGVFPGWTSSGMGQVEVVRVRQRLVRGKRGPGGGKSEEEDEDDSAREWEDAVKASSAAAAAEEAGLSESAREDLINQAAEAETEGEAEDEIVVELVMRRLTERSGDDLLLRHAVSVENRVLPAHAALAAEQGVSAGSAASSAPAVLACSMLLEGDDERLGAEFEGDMVPYLLRFDSPVDAARFRIAYDRARGTEAEEEAARALEAGDHEAAAAAVEAAGSGHGRELMPASEARVLFVELLQPYPFAVCRALSAEERQGKGLISAQLAYSEVTFRGVAELLQSLREDLKLPTLTRGGGKFVDLGSGVGKAVFAAAMAHSFTELVGVEMLQGLHEGAVHVLDRFDEAVRPKLPPPRRRSAVQFLRDDFTQVPWLDADVVFCVSTTFDAAVMSRIAALSNDMRRGAVMITTTTRLPSARWAVVKRFDLEMAHGKVTGFVHEKRMR